MEEILAKRKTKGKSKHVIVFTEPYDKPPPSAQGEAPPPEDPAPEALSPRGRSRLQSPRPQAPPSEEPKPKRQKVEEVEKKAEQ